MKNKDYWAGIIITCSIMLFIGLMIGSILPITTKEPLKYELRIKVKEGVADTTYYYSRKPLKN